MISVSNDYKNNLNNRALSPKSKIIVDGVTYLGDVIKTFPKIKHQATDVIGCFPAKTVSFEIYDYNNELDFINKEVEVYQGFMINGTPVYVKQGIFIPKDENVKTNISNKVISFENVQDRTQLLEDKYESNLDWSNNQTHTGLEIVQEICTRKQITLKTSNFSFANYQFKQPNFPENITDRQVIARLGEIGGENAYFDYNGELVIKGQTNTNDILQRSRYEKISIEKTVTYNTVILGKKDINDDIVYPSTIAVERVERRIEDNPFVDLIREEIIEEVAQHIIGLTYTPYELQGCVDGHIYELNDVISVIDRNGNTVRAVILDFENSSRIKSKIKLSLESKNTTNYNLAGSNKESLDKVRLDVDHINNEIRGIVSSISGEDGLSQRVNSVETRITSTDYRINAISKNVTYTEFDEDGNPTNSDINSVKTKEKNFTFNDDGFDIATPDSNFRLHQDETGSYYYEGNNVIGQYTKDGSKQKDLELFGTYSYGKKEINDTPMFVAQLYTDENGEEGFGHFCNRS